MDCLSSFLNIEDHLQAIGTQKVFEATLKKILVDSTCAAYDTLDSVSVTYEPMVSGASKDIVLQGAVMEHE
jgi:altronate dehydratase